MTRLIVLAAVIVSFCAGAMVDRFVSSHGMPPRPQGVGPASWLANQLNLTADQQAKMKDIWQNTFRRGGGGPDQHDKRAELRRQQEQDIAALVRQEDRPAYDKIVADTKIKVDAMDAEQRKAFETAVAQTKLILTPEQLKKYEQIAQRPWDHHDHDRPATRPGNS